ncbi:MAG: bacillithiol system redox-active protein YtxJ [Chitinophagaceae bacterium]|jgi:bacillithiol system protein YtxJ|nr:bacillithiol system redox-active protein YtxJ [Chitinophagaceae bacterium]
MNWNQLTEVEQIDKIIEDSFLQSQIIFKHSTRCSISSMALKRLERSEPLPNVTYYFLDLIAHRNVSNEIAVRFGEEHQSPQLLLIKNGKCVYNESHTAIDIHEMAENIL